MARYFYGCMGVCLRLRGSRGSPSIGTFTSSGRSKLRTQTGAFTRFTSFNVHEFQFPSGTYGIPVCLVLLHCIRTLRTGFELDSRCIRDIFKPIQRKYLFEQFEQIEIGRIHSFAIPDGGVVETIRLILHCIRTLRTGFEPGSIIIKHIQRYAFFDIVFDTSRSDSNPARNTNVYEVHKLCSNVYELRSNDAQNTFTGIANTYSKFKRITWT